MAKKKVEIEEKAEVETKKKQKKEVAAADVAKVQKTKASTTTKNSNKSSKSDSPVIEEKKTSKKIDSSKPTDTNSKTKVEAKSSDKNSAKATPKKETKKTPDTDKSKDTSTKPNKAKASKNPEPKANDIDKIEQKVIETKQVNKEVDKDKKIETTKSKNEPPAPVFNPDIRYSDSELEEFAVLITHEKENALEELRMLKERLDDLTSFSSADDTMIYSMHMAEQGSEAQEKEKTYAQIQRIHEYIKKLEDAMERIKNKTYGICRVCGCLIAKARLRAVPITTLSASYKIHQKCPEDGIDRIEPLKK